MDKFSPTPRNCQLEDTSRLIGSVAVLVKDGKHLKIKHNINDRLHRLSLQYQRCPKIQLPPHTTHHLSPLGHHEEETEMEIEQFNDLVSML